MNDEYTIDVSIGNIVGKETIIIKGPLIGREKLIRKFGRHKRIAYLNLELFDQQVLTKVGLEIISKN